MPAVRNLAILDQHRSHIETRNRSRRPASPAELSDVNVLHKLSENYYKDELQQVHWSFTCACILQAVAVAFTIAAICFEMANENFPGVAATVAGTAIQVITGVVFVLYSRAARQFRGFHTCLERANRYILANSLCDRLSNRALRDTTRAALVETIKSAMALDPDERPSVAHGVSGQAEPAELSRLVAHASAAA